MKVFRNEEGANLLNGIASTLIKNCSIFGKLNYDAGIFELDESNLDLIIDELSNVKCQMTND